MMSLRIRRLTRAGVLLAVAGLVPVGAAPAHAARPAQWPLAPGGVLDVQTAWRAGQGRGVVVAVLDTGVDLGHPDLAGAAWTNPRELAGNGTDDDGNGFVDDVHGADLVDHDGDPADVEGHGTHVAGTIAARGTGQGVMGVAPGAQIMAVRVLDANAHGLARDVAAGIRYALAEGADVINTSLVGTTPNADVREAVAAATAAGVPVVSAAGNDGRDLEITPAYPASFDEPSVIAVTAVDDRGALASFANYGSRSVDLAAPGVAIVSTRRGGGVEARSGTSMAAAHVSGTLALLAGARPDLGLDGLRAALDVGAAHGAVDGAVGFGVLDAGGAVRTVVPASRLAAPPLLTATVRQHARRGVRTRIGWTLSAAAPRGTRIEVRDAAGRRLAAARGTTRSAWVARRSGTVLVRAFAARGAKLATVRLRLR